jgi:hypothetical protein
VPDNRNKSANQNRYVSSLFEIMFRRLQFFLVQQKIFSEFPDERFASVISDGVGYQRSDDASQRADDDYSLERKLFGRDQESCERHDRFARYRENHAFHHHSDEDSDISGLMDEGGDVGRKELGNSHKR